MMKKKTHLNFMFAIGVIVSWVATAVIADDVDDLGILEEAINTGPRIERIVIEGLEEKDHELVLQKIQSEEGKPLDEETLAQDRERVDGMEEFVVDSVQKKPVPAAEKKIKIIFGVYYENVDVDIAFKNASDWTVTVGPHQLLQTSPGFPALSRFLTPEKAEASKPERRKYYKWARKSEQSWNEEENVLTSEHEWGSYSIEYSPGGDRMDLTITVRNKMDKPIQFARIYLSGNFAFPERPPGYWWRHNRVLTPSPEKAPPVIFGDYGQGVVAVCLLGKANGARFGFRGKRGQRRLVMEFNGVPAGGTQTVRGSIRFGLGRAAGGDPFELVSDVYDAFREKHPRIFEWPDRRPIGALHPSSSAKGLFKAGNPKNPRGWKMGRAEVDITTEEGRERFKKQALDWARNCVRIAKGMNAQGVIVWSIEGQQYPHATSYIGSPDKIGRLAPEMDAIADEFFKVFADAGLRTGVCIRPQKLIIPDEVPDSDSVKPKQKRQWDGDRIPVEDIVETLDRKLTYAKDRWGASIFYVDSNVSSKWEKNEETGKWKPTRWETQPAEIFAELARRHPDCLIVPEHEYFLYWAYSAPIAATPERVQQVWPDAFSVNLMQHFDPGDPQAVQRFERLVGRGDILLFRGWYNYGGNKVIRQIYERQHTPKWHDPDVISEQSATE